MKKIAALTLFTVLICTFILAGGQKETGRNYISSTADTGDLIESSYIDTSSFINAYAFPTRQMNRTT